MLKFDDVLTHSPGRLEITQFVPSKLVSKLGVLPEIGLQAKQAMQPGVGGAGVVVPAAFSLLQSVATSPAQAPAPAPPNQTAGLQQTADITPFPIVLQNARNQQDHSSSFADGKTMREKEQAALAKARNSIMNTGQSSPPLSTENVLSGRHSATFYSC